MLGRIGFGFDPQPTRSDRVYKKWIRSRPNIRVKPNISGHRLSGLKSLGDFRFEEQHIRIKPKPKEHGSQVTTTIQK